jgi:hypothetical protein
MAFRTGRKVIMGFLAVVLSALLLAACSSSASTSSSTSIGQTSATATTAPPTATATLPPPTATRVPGPFDGTPAFVDSLTGAGANQWDVVSDPNQASCQFGGDGYHIVIYPAYGITCFSRAATFGDFAFRVTMKFVKGTTTDHGGIVFRSNGGMTNVSGYDLYMRADGRYTLATCSSDNCGSVLMQGTAGNFHPGLNVSNTLAVVAKGGKLSLYVNGHFIQSVTNAAFSNGYLGLQNTPNNGSTLSEVVYANAEAWRL